MTFFIKSLTTIKSNIQDQVLTIKKKIQDQVHILGANGRTLLHLKWSEYTYIIVYKRILFEHHSERI